jgi:hypothetical protein
MEKLAEKTVTETLARAMERADRMSHVIVIYETLEGEEVTGGILVDDAFTLAGMNYLFDLGKKWIFGE